MDDARMDGGDDWIGLCDAEVSDAGEFALYSHCKRYRYLLTRYAKGDGTLAVIMLNPSTATAFKDDPTIRRVRQFATRWGREHVRIGNLFAYRSPHPRDLKTIDDPAGPLNNTVLRWLLQTSEVTLVAWGTHPAAAERGALLAHFARELDVELLCLGTNADGSPIHPMARGKNRVPDDQQPMIWEGQT